jgi:hypothetical protein
LGRYPLALTLQEQGGITDEVLKQLGDFLADAPGRRCRPEEVNRLYSANTPAAVAEALLEGIRARLN